MHSALLLLLFSPLISYSSATTTPTVKVSNGFLVGTTTSLPGATSTVNKYLGIPYASSPPVRFAPPAPAANWATPRDASAFGPACIQQLDRDNTFSPFEPTESEDCLYINVFQPGGPAPSAGRAVMVWIYGGALQFGSGGIRDYDGSSFASYEDVILVTFNYRVSIFGFPGAPGIPNLGYLDQRFALSWVQKNIKAFGGDPKRVTIFGESAGGISVDALLLLPPTEKSFQAAIVQSGTALSNALINTGANPSRNWDLAATTFNCSSAVSQVDCLRQIPASTLGQFALNNSLSISPVVDNITYIPASPQNRASSRAAHVPVLVGTTADEGSAFTFFQTNLTAFITTLFAAVPHLQANITQAYTVGAPGIYNPTQAIAQLFTDLAFRCPSAILASQVTAAGNSVWQYVYNATFPNLTPAPGLGAYHSSEIPMVFSTYNMSTATAQQYALSNYMRGAWAGFARNPSSGPGWGRVGSFNGIDLGVLGLNGGSGVTVVSPTTALVDIRCHLFDDIYDLLV